MMSIVGKILNLKEMVKFPSCMKLTLATLLIDVLCDIRGVDIRTYSCHIKILRIV